MIGAVNVMVQILAVRMILLLGVIGAFALGWGALAQDSPLRLVALGIYTATVVLPLVWLASR